MRRLPDATGTLLNGPPGLVARGEGPGWRLGVDLRTFEERLMRPLRGIVAAFGLVGWVRAQQPKVITLGDARFQVRVSLRTGALLEGSARRPGPQGNGGRIRVFGGEAPPVDVRVGGRWLLGGRRQAAPADAVCLDGPWRFRTANGEWRDLRVPGAWESQGVTHTEPDTPEPTWTPYNGTAFYRTTFRVPEPWRGKPLRLIIDGVDDEDWTSVNGTEIGHTGMETPEWWQATRIYDFQADALSGQAEDALEIKVYDRGGEGGITGSVYLALAEKGVRRGARAWSVVSHRQTREGHTDTLSLRATHGDWRADMHLRLDTRTGLLLRGATWTYDGKTPADVQGVRFCTAGACIGPADSCRFTMPTFWPPREIAITEIPRGHRYQAHSSEATPPADVLHAPSLGLGLCATLFTDEEYAGVSAVRREDALDLYGEAAARGTLEAGDAISIGGYAVALVTGDLLDTLAAAGACWEAAGFKLAQRPSWTEGAAAYSLWAGGSVDSNLSDIGGLRSFQKHVLPRLDRLGIDIVWFNPLNRGSYGPVEHRAVEPRLGTLEDLRDVCTDAHAREMRVWLDLIPHGPRENSPDGKDILTNHREWVSRDTQGEIKYWWGCLCCDYANPGWQAEMADVATYFVKQCDIDGWRVDCAQGSPPNERPVPGLRPSQSGIYGALRLLRKVRTELQAAKPDAALLGETGSACHLTQCDFVYDWITQRAAYQALPATPADVWVPRAKQWLARQQAALPPGAEFGLMRFLENHDQFRSVRRYGVGHESALLSLCALIPGLPFVFNEQDGGFGTHLARLFELRQTHDVFRKGAADYLNVASSSPSVFAFARRHEAGVALVAINFGGVPRRVRVTSQEAALPAREPTTLYAGTEAYTQTLLGRKPLREWRTVDINLPAYATRVVLLRPAPDGPSPTPVPKASQPESVAETASLTVFRDGSRVVVGAAAYRAVLENGLIRQLTPAGGETPLLSGMDVVEGRRKVWAGRRLQWAEQVSATPEVRREGDKVLVSYQGVLVRGTDTRIAWRASYEFNPKGTVHVAFGLTPPPFGRAVKGQLGLELRFASAERWRVNTFEGALDDTLDRVHPGGDMVVGHRYWHRSGLPWESTLHPLDPGHPTVAVAGDGKWLHVELPDAATAMENVYLRERTASGDDCLTLHLGWLDEKGTADLTRPLEAVLRLRVADSPPDAPAGTARFGQATISSQGSRYGCQAPGHELVFCRGLGGSIVHVSEPGGETLVSGSEVYSDRGIYTARTNSVGADVKTLGASRFDFEPDLVLRSSASGDGVLATLTSYLRMSYWSWANVASPRVQYAVSYDLSGTHALRTECRARPMVSDQRLQAFLAQRLTIPGVTSWRVEATDGTVEGTFSTTDGKGRVWQSANQPLSGAISLTATDGRVLRIADLTTSKDDTQNVFLLDSGKQSAVLFFAFLDGREAPYSPRWRRVAYSMEVRCP